MGTSYKTRPLDADPLEDPSILTIRFAVLDDVPLLKTMIHEFAEFERLVLPLQMKPWLGTDLGRGQVFAFSWRNGTVKRLGTPSSSTTIRRLRIG